ncbi:MAG: hypothetical protein JO323_03685 [Acidobacteriia bacterium]|nr:hypothetical protein [Terriglobia bacterium]
MLKWQRWAVLFSLLGSAGLGSAQVDDAPSLAGVIDIHAHVAPETALLNFKRAYDALEAAQIARIYGMRGIVLKEHNTETASWAYLVSQMVPAVEVYGGIVLNKAVGGINPVAVESMALTRGGRGRVVYMPTVDAEARNPPGAPRAVPVSRNGQLLPEVSEVLKVVAKYDLGLSTGHVSADEALMVIRAAKQAGVRNIYVQHPNHGGIVMSMARMKEAVGLGALIEIVLSGEGFTGGGPKVVNAENPVMDYGPQKLADIRALGPANIIISTDLGQPGRVNYAQAFQMALAVLAKSGFTKAEIDMMTKQNPARFLGLK